MVWSTALKIVVNIVLKIVVKIVGKIIVKIIVKFVVNIVVKIVVNIAIAASNKREKHHVPCCSASAMSDRGGSGVSPCPGSASTKPASCISQQSCSSTTAISCPADAATRSAWCRQAVEHIHHTRWSTCGQQLSSRFQHLLVLLKLGMQQRQRPSRNQPRHRCHARHPVLGPGRPHPAPSHVVLVRVLMGTSSRSPQPTRQQRLEHRAAPLCGRGRGGRWRLVPRDVALGFEQCHPCLS